MLPLVEIVPKQMRVGVECLGPMAWLLLRCYAQEEGSLGRLRLLSGIAAIRGDRVRTPTCCQQIQRIERSSSEHRPGRLPLRS